MLLPLSGRTPLPLSGRTLLPLLGVRYCHCLGGRYCHCWAGGDAPSNVDLVMSECIHPTPPLSPYPLLLVQQLLSEAQDPRTLDPRP